MNGELPIPAPVATLNIPAELRGYDQWLVWRYERDPKAKKPRKVPYSPLSGRRTGTTEKERNTWGSFDQALNAYSSGNYSGLGFVFSQDDPFVGIDLDHCAFDGTPDSFSEGIIGTLKTYTEISPSGTGFHLIVRGRKPGAKCKIPRSLLVKDDKGDFTDDMEMYDSNRYFTVTGNTLGDCLIQQDQARLEELYWEYMEADSMQLEPLTPQPEPPLSSNVPKTAYTTLEISNPVKTSNTINRSGYFKIPDDDNELIDIIRKSKQADKFSALYDRGDLSLNQNDHSSADNSLCCMFAWYTGKDYDRIERLFAGSKLIREKWLKRHDYRKRTIEKSIEQTRGQYKGKWYPTDEQHKPETPAANVVDFPKKQPAKSRTIHFTETGFINDEPLFTGEMIAWPDLGTFFHISPNTGALYQGYNAEDGKAEIIALRPIWLHSLASDEMGESYRVIKFYDHDLNMKEICIPAQWYAKGKDANIWSALLALGMQLMSGKEKYVARYMDMSAVACNNRSWAAAKVGWFDVPGREENPVFVLPNIVLGNTGDNRDVFFQQLQKLSSQPISPRGTVAEWKREIADKALGNSLIMFVICASFAGAMTKLAGVGSGGFHFWGSPRCGKTILAQIAASVWGNGSDPQIHSSKTSIRKWNNTANALEVTAQLHNDLVLCLDEIGELDNPQDLNKLIYSLTGGTPKGRMQDTGGLRDQAFWHIMLISTGELSTEAVLKLGGITKRGGQTHRLPDIRVDALENGIVQIDNVDPVAFTNALKQSASMYYGTSGPVFVSWLINAIQKKGFQNFVNETNELIISMERTLLDGIEELSIKAREIRAVIKRLAAVAVAGSYASEAGLLDWTPQKITDAVVFVRNLWISEMGENITEEDKALAVIRNNIITNMANFENVNDNSAKLPIKTMGYQNNDFIMILPSWMDEFCGSYSKRQLLKALNEKQYLSVDDGRFNKKIPARAWRKERPRCHWISKNFLDD